MQETHARTSFANEHMHMYVHTDDEEIDEGNHDHDFSRSPAHYKRTLLVLVAIEETSNTKILS